MRRNQLSQSKLNRCNIAATKRRKPAGYSLRQRSPLQQWSRPSFPPRPVALPDTPADEEAPTSLLSADSSSDN